MTGVQTCALPICGKRLKVLRARLVEDNVESGVIDGLRVGTATGAIELLTVQPEGKSPQDAHAWRNGAHPQPGERLG